MRLLTFVLIALTLVVVAGAASRSQKATAGGDCFGSFVGLAPYAQGLWDGTWDNETFDSHGELQITLDTHSDCTFELTIEGLFGVAGEHVIEGTYHDASGGVTIEIVNDDVVGDMSMTINLSTGDVEVVGSGAQLNIASYSAAGRLTDRDLTLDFTLTFQDSSTAHEFVYVRRHIGYEWANWLCLNDKRAMENFVQQLRYVAGLPVRDVPNCPDFGDELFLGQTFGEEDWGDTDCNGSITAADALNLLTWYAGDDGTNDSCPDNGNPNSPQFDGQAEWDSVSLDYEVIDTTGTQGSAGLDEDETFVQVNAEARNLGPDSSGAGLFFETRVYSGDIRIRWIPLSGDGCFDDLYYAVPCGEGNPGGTPAQDECLDNGDNDADSLVDYADPDCVEIRAVRESILLFPGPNAGSYERWFTIACLSPGPVDIDIVSAIEVEEGYGDYDGNNYRIVNFQAECVDTGS